MNDIRGPRADPTDPEGGPGRTCSVVEAARLLGIGERSVRKQITAGKLPARKVEGAWVVTLPADLADPTGGPGSAPRSEPLPSPTTIDYELADELKHRITDLELDRDRWHEQAQRTGEQLATEQESVRGLIVALSRAEQRAEIAEGRIDELLAITSTVGPSQAAPEATGATEEQPLAELPTLGALDKQRRPWWERLKWWE